MTDGEKAMINSARHAADIGVYFFLAYCAVLTGEMLFFSVKAAGLGFFFPLMLPVVMPEGFDLFRPFRRAHARA